MSHALENFRLQEKSDLFSSKMLVLSDNSPPEASGF
jgi:hypothetical protein